MTTNQKRVITFYSYKGGVGRTMALASVAVQLAKWGYKVLAIDMDLEAPGLHAFFRPWLKASVRRGVIELLETFDKPSVTWRDSVVRLKAPGAEHPLAFMPAGRLDHNYLQRVQALDWDELYARKFGRFLESMRAEWVADFDFILIDSRTGVSDSGGVCTIQLPNYLVVLCTANDQSVSGVADIATRAQEGQAKLPLDRGRLLVVPVPTRLDQTEYELRKLWHERFVRALGGFVREWAGAEKGVVAELVQHLGVPYIPYWSYGEGIPTLRDTSADKLSVGFAHETLAALLANDLGSVDDLLSNREGFVRQAAAGSRSEGEQVDVFLSYAAADQKTALALTEQLRERGYTVRLGGETREVHSPAASVRALSARDVRSAKSVVILVGSDPSQAQAFEVQEAVTDALSQAKTIVPIFLAPSPNGRSRVRTAASGVTSLLAQFQGISAAPVATLAERLAKRLRLGRIAPAIPQQIKAAAPRTAARKTTVRRKATVVRSAKRSRKK
jgi:MinD-like ATPase involved in chromosome partitioning or flagellar assembly